MTDNTPSSPGSGVSSGLTISDLGGWLADEDLTERMLEWAPDVAALTTALLQRSQAFRFVVSPPAGAGWPPPEPPFSELVAETAAAWRSMLDHGEGEVPDLVRRLFTTVLEHGDTPVSDIADGHPWELCAALLTLHAIADETAAGCGGNPVGVPGGAVHLARAHELLARTGSMARFPRERAVHLPKTRTTPVGMTHRSLSRYSCTTTDGVAAVWHRAPLRRVAGDATIPNANVLLLPWPLRIRETDFVPVPGSVRRPEREPFGFFRYEPSEALDLDLVDALLSAALDEVEHVDVVAMPEGFLQPGEVEALEELLARRGVSLLVAGLRIDRDDEGRLPGNGVHIGVHLGDHWWHYRQNKHHRWFLDGGQVEQYNISGALHPSVRWWEQMEIPRRAVNIIELGNGITVAAVVCEDLARIDGVAEMLRSVGPTLVVTLLLDGPQLLSRWTSRYAGVLADDPGSAVLTLTAYGMTQRSRPRGMPPSGVVAMWKDPLRGAHEIPLEAGAQGVLLKAVQGRSPRYSADGRKPADDATDLYVAGIQQLRAQRGQAAPTAGSQPPTGHDGPGDEEPLDTVELGIVYSWCQAVAAAMVGAPGRDGSALSLDQVLEQAGPGAGWRERLGVPTPSARLGSALETLASVARETTERAATSAPADLVTTVLGVPEVGLDGLVRRILAIALDSTPPAG